jgi:Small-conductance mechanosensitive channel
MMNYKCIVLLGEINMANTNEFVLSDHGEATAAVIQAVVNKSRYLQTLHEALEDQDDRLVYQLINSEKYAREVQQARHISADPGNESLVEDLHDQLSAFLSQKLIIFLRNRYPFFYFEEIGEGQYQFYFGNWWGRRLFGTLDVLNVSFDFDEVEYQKLARTFALETQQKRLNSDQIEQISLENDKLQELIDSQEERDNQKAELRSQIKQISQEKVMPWEANRQKEEKQALIDKLTELTEIDESSNNAFQQIRQNENRILELSKEDTLLSYEKQSIIAKFGSFENFEAQNNVLYRDYIANLIATRGRVSADE